MKTRRKWLFAFLLAIAIVAACALLLPWKLWLEEKLKAELVTRGLPPIEFSVDHVGPKGITLKDISLDGLRLQSLTIGYAPLELWHGNVRDIKAGDIVVKQNDTEITLGAVEASLSPAADGKSWQGNWLIHSITVKDAPVGLPPLEAAGTLQWQTGIAGKIGGDIKSADNAYRASFTLNYPVNDKPKAIFILSSAAMPWNGGIVQTHNVSVPLYGTAPIAVKLELKRVPINPLLQGATGNRASATGVVSGLVPLVLRRGGTFTVQAGKLQAEQAGTIILQPDAIPGDSQQVTLVREVLKNFHYQTLSLGIDSGKDKQLSMLLSLSGNNPDVYNGRVVNLNVHLSGDLLGLLQNSFLTADDAKRLLK